jgi:ABC-2 type transport system ATP-binding protein
MTTTDPQDPIVTRSLTKRYDELTAVDALNLEVHAGEIFGLLGQNGAGKTTTILMLLGLTEPTSGVARVLGLDPTRRPLEVKRHVGYLPDSVGFYGGMTGRENLRYTARLNGLERREADRRIGDVLAQVGLTDRGDTNTNTYSRGMLQRLGIADALVKDPSVLILDEPTTAIDPLGVVGILDLLRSLVRDRGMAILLSSHLLTQVQSVCDRVGIFHSGRMIGQGTVDDLAKRFGEDTAHVEVGLEPDPAIGAAAILERGEAAFRAIDDVVAVTRPARANEPWVLDVRPAASEGRVRRDVLTACAANGLTLSTLKATVPTLDEIYRHAVERAQARTGRAA